MRSPSTSSQPLHEPSWASRQASRKARPLALRSTCGGLLEGGDVALPGEVVGQAVLGRVERAAQRLEPLDHLDPERPDRGVQPVEAELAGGPHHPVLVAAAHEGEGVGDAEVRVLAHAR